MLRTPLAKAAPPSMPALFYLLEDGPHSVLLLRLALPQQLSSSVDGVEGGEDDTPPSLRVSARASSDLNPPMR